MTQKTLAKHLDEYTALAQQIAALAGALVRLRGGTLEGPFPLTAPPGAKRTGQVLALLLNDPSKAWEPPDEPSI